MTQFTVQTYPAEADAIMDGRTVIFRNNFMKYKVGDEITFRVIRNKKQVRHSIDKRKYEIIYIADWDKAPMEDGYVAINFKRIA